ncbi:hypothetical protein J6590_005177 [Homalodisca vitripennis]|nr:hypothetical protein J6590_005177 [Homalodisca vitripennis]
MKEPEQEEKGSGYHISSLLVMGLTLHGQHKSCDGGFRKSWATPTVSQQNLPSTFQIGEISKLPEPVQHDNMLGLSAPSQDMGHAVLKSRQSAFPPTVMPTHTAVDGNRRDTNRRRKSLFPGKLDYGYTQHTLRLSRVVLRRRVVPTTRIQSPISLLSFPVKTRETGIVFRKYSGFSAIPKENVESCVTPRPGRDERTGWCERKSGMHLYIEARTEMRRGPQIWAI